MISINVTPQDKKLVIEIPDEMVNKQLHVEIREENIVSQKQNSVDELRTFFRPFLRDMSDFHLNRDELHER